MMHMEHVIELGNIGNNIVNQWRFDSENESESKEAEWDLEENEENWK